jgi:hypothetical protein
MKTEEILRYDRMYRVMRELLDADVITFGFWVPTQPEGSQLARILRENPASEDEGRPPYNHLAGGGGL